jgi:chemotaxis protein methyltransferase CheR
MRWPGFPRVRRQVCRRLAQRLDALGLPDLTAYRRYLAEHPAEWQLLDACCRITVSRFYRDRAVFEALGRRVLPVLAARARAEARGELRAWSAGCGSGEEVYSLRALWQLEVAPHHPKLRLHVIGTDAEETCIARARRGCYAASSLRELPADWRERVFAASPDSEQPGEVCVRAPFREGVELRKQDLRRAMPEGPFDLVLCRNLAFTYFDTELQREVLEGILLRLAPGGALVIGVHEHLPLARDAAGPEPARVAPWDHAPATFRSRGASEPVAPLTIECRVDAANGDPVAFGRRGALRSVAEVLDRWPGEGHRYFRVRTADGAVAILRHDEDRDRWALHYFERSEAETRGHSRP